MSLYITLNTPSAFDFHAFSEATIQSLELLAPFLEVRDSSPLSQRIVGQVKEYINAIQCGFIAARYGFTTADDIISLAQLLDGSMPEEREEYLIGTLELANKAYSAAQESCQAFRNVRSTMTFLMEQQVDQLRSIHNGGQSTGGKMLSSIRNATSQISVFENFAAHACALARWWDWVRIEVDPRTHANGHAPSVSFDCESLRHRSVIQRWILLRNQYADFTVMGRRLQDLYPFLMTGDSQRSTRRSSRITPRDDIQHALRVLGGTRQRQTLSPDVYDNVGPWIQDEKSHRDVQACCCIIM